MDAEVGGGAMTQRKDIDMNYGLNPLDLLQEVSVKR